MRWAGRIYIGRVSSKCNEHPTTLTFTTAISMAKQTKEAETARKAKALKEEAIQQAVLLPWAPDSLCYGDEGDQARGWDLH